MTLGAFQSTKMLEFTQKCLVWLQHLGREFGILWFISLVLLCLWLKERGSCPTELFDLREVFKFPPCSHLPFGGEMIVSSFHKQVFHYFSL